jgi:hypothetical protein
MAAQIGKRFDAELCKMRTSRFGDAGQGGYRAVRGQGCRLFRRHGITSQSNFCSVFIISYLTAKSQVHIRIPRAVSVCGFRAVSCRDGVFFIDNSCHICYNGLKD